MPGKLIRAWGPVLALAWLAIGCGTGGVPVPSAADSRAVAAAAPIAPPPGNQETPPGAENFSPQGPTEGSESHAAVQPDGHTSEVLPDDLGTRPQGVDWPAFLGPTGDSKSSETGLLTDWNMHPPRLVWQKRLGTGYGIGAVSRGRFFQFDRWGNKARLTCLRAETGENLWEFDYPSDFEDGYGYNNGPRASPVVDGSRVYIYGAEGWLHCLSAADGKLLWKVDTLREFGVIENFFGVGSTPVIEGNLLLVMVGGSPPEAKNLARGRLDLVTGNGSAIVAFDKFSGEVKYRLSNELASYATLRLATVGGQRWGFAFLRGGLLAFEPRAGTAHFFFPWRARILESVNASTPVVQGNEVFISETYGRGSALLEVSPGNFRVAWSDSATAREKSLECHWNTPILHQGYLYGSSGRHEANAELRCVEWKTGRVRWSEPGLSRASLLYVDGHFVCLGEDGALMLLKVNPEKFERVGSLTLRDEAAGPQPFGLGAPPLLRAPCWAAPILSHGLLYLRGEGRLVCLEVIAAPTRTN